MMKLRLGIATVLGAAIALAPAGAAFADYPPSAPTVQLVASSATCSDVVNVSGSNWKGTSTVSLSLQTPGTALGNVTTNASGSFTGSITVPNNAPVGPNMVVASGSDTNGAAATASTALTINSTNCTTTTTSSTTTSSTTSSSTTSTTAGTTTTTSGSSSPSTTTVSVLGTTVQQPSTPAAVAPSNVAAPSSALPFTGAGAVAFLVTIGLVCLGLGFVAVMAARRRAHAD